MEASVEGIDYSQWQRKAPETKTLERRRQRKPTESRQTAVAAVTAAAASGYDTFSIGSGQLSRIGSACSLSKCQHPWNNFRAMEAAKNAREKKRARMKELNVRIQLHEKTLAEIKQREAELLRSNMELFSLIENDEASAAEEANQTLAKYEQSRNTISVMRLRFERQRRELSMEVEQMRRRLGSSIGRLKSEVEKVTQQVKDIYNELALLNNYKDKVYPERLVLIHQLKQKLAAQQLNNEEEESELLQIIQTEHKNLMMMDCHSIQEMKESVAQQALSELHPSLIAKADENKKLAADIDFHQSMNEGLIEDIRRLEAGIHEMKNDAESSVVKSMFPQIFREKATCSPDTELTFDIPSRKLPVI